MKHLPTFEAFTDKGTEILPYGVKELQDGLTVEELKSKFPWILKAKIKDAVIGEFNGNLVWYDGTWKGGTWKGGEWFNGTWEDGTWEDGTWDKGTWKNGTWDKGTWCDGQWLNGTWTSGTWERGKWLDKNNPHPNER